MSSIQRSNKSSSRSKRRNRNKVTETSQLQNEKMEKEVEVMEETVRQSSQLDMNEAQRVAMNELQREVQAREGEKKPEITNMAEALVLQIILKLEKLLATKPYYIDKMEEVAHDMRMIMDFVRDNKLGEDSRLYYLICDLVEMVDDLSKYKLGIHPVGYWVSEVKIRMLKFGVQTRSENAGDREIDEEYVVGLDKDVEMLLGKLLFDWEEGLSTWLITGMVGIGKTTLARHLYKHVTVIDRYKCRAWVHVANELSHKEVLIELIQQVSDSEKLQNKSLLEKTDNRNLQNILRQQLKGRSYFIVLDDVPIEMNLGCIFKGLQRKDKGSRLLITGRSQSFSLEETLGKAYNVHVVKALDSNRSWQLFLRTIECANEYEFPKQLEKKGKEMLSKCGGVPSAIKEVGRQLVEKRKSGIEWEQLLGPVDLGASTTMELLESSYHKLDPDSKSCFLHLALFKENTTIKREKLIHIWSAGGSASNIDFAYDTLETLTKRSMIEVKDYPMKSFRINSLLHRLSIEKAKEEMGFGILSINGNDRTSQRPRHRVICCSRDKFDYSTNQDKNLVSLFFRGGGNLDASPSYWESLQRLRLLELEDFGLKVLSEAIGTLKLRYLGLRNNHIQELPHSFGCLKKLEVLDIAQNFMVEVPDIIWRMDCLRVIYMSDVICQKPLKIDAIKTLETLLYIPIDDWAYEPSALQMMVNLKKLGIEEVDGNSDASKLFASLSKLKRLDYLILRGFLFKGMPCLDELGILRIRITKLKLDGLLPTLPSANNMPPKLTYLKLVNSCLDQDPMAVLEKLPKLKYLKLRNAYTGRQMAILHKGFPHLHVLCMEELWNLRNVEVEEGAMPRLRKLEINNCPYLETLPEKIGLVEELKMVTSKKVATKIRKQGLISIIRIVDINI